MNAEMLLWLLLPVNEKVKAAVKLLTHPKGVTSIFNLSWSALVKLAEVIAGVTLPGQEPHLLSSSRCLMRN